MRLGGQRMAPVHAKIPTFLLSILKTIHQKCPKYLNPIYKCEAVVRTHLDSSELSFE